MTDHISGQPHDRSALILYGSETGTSQEAAEQLGRITERLRFETTVAEMDWADLGGLIKYTFVIFTIGTTGQGDVPANARKFWKCLLRKRLPANCLNHLSFTTFGFGDSSYVKFNWAARKLHKRLEQLGAQQIHPRGEADEQHEEGTDGAFLPWSLEFKSQILQRYPLPDGLLAIPDAELLSPKWSVELIDSSEEFHEATSSIHPSLQATTMTPAEPDHEIQGNLHVQNPMTTDSLNASYDMELPPTDILSIPDAHTAIVDQNTRLTPADHWQDVRHINFLIRGKADYSPGDIAIIYPKNFPSDVEALIKLMGWIADADKPLRFKQGPSSHPNDMISITSLSKVYTTTPPTLRSLLLHNLDITAIPKRFFFELCSKYTSNPMHRDRLVEFSNPAYTDEYYDYATRPRRSMLEVLQDFPSVRFPFSSALVLFPPIRPRQFSIASGGVLKQPNHPSDTTSVQLCVAIVRYRTILRKTRHGLCSRYLAALSPGSPVAIVIQPGTLHFPASHFQKPLLMIAPGTGLAPMRSLIWERALHLGLHASSPSCSSLPPSIPTTPQPPPPPTAILLFGNRSQQKDYLYAPEWTSLTHPLSLTLWTAFSRDQPRKRYVQDVIREQATTVYDLLVRQGGRVLVCGSSGKMPVAVRVALVDALQVGRWDEESFEDDREGRDGRREEAEEEVRRLEREGRYYQETW